jgi:outer membrane protein TolC
MSTMNERSVVVGAILTAALCFPTRASALQPIDVFLAGAQETNPDVRAQVATVTQRQAEMDKATGALLPALQAQGTYMRNQYQTEFPASIFGGTGTIVITPQNQRDVSLSLNAPLVDVAAWERRAAARATRDGAHADLASSRLDLSRRVAQAYYQLVANEAVLLSARHNLELSRDNAALTENRRGGGTASELDVQRAKGNVARSEQDVIAAALNVTTVRRSLETLSGIRPEPASELVADDLHEEVPLETWLVVSERLPLVRSAKAAQRSAEESARASAAAWLPTLTGSAQERFTNAPSLSSHRQFYLLLLTATWKLDMMVPPALRAQKAVADVATARAEGVRRQVGDAIFNDWHQIRAAIDRSRAARTQVEAARVAAGLARDRYQGGIATQLDVLQAQQDLFRADVSRIQADADLAFWRASLRVDTAQPIGDRTR